MLLSPGAAAAGDASRNARPAIRARTSGTFEVELTPQAQPADAAAGRMSLRKRFSGGLEGVSTGEMLISGSAASSGAYVAIERVTGLLAGRSGSFVLVHRGIMANGRPDLAIAVVPASGTGELAGLSGTMTVRIEGRRHLYSFDYDLPRSG